MLVALASLLKNLNFKSYYLFNLVAFSLSTTTNVFVLCFKKPLPQPAGLIIQICFIEFLGFVQVFLGGQAEFTAYVTIIMNLLQPVSKMAHSMTFSQLCSARRYLRCCKYPCQVYCGCDQYFDDILQQAYCFTLVNKC